ncbi:hypothetical protein [Anabaena azotica]
MDRDIEVIFISCNTVMFSIGDYVLNQQTGHLGKVVGYGNYQLNQVDTATLKVLVAETANSQKRVFVVEDKVSAWIRWSVAS